MASTKPDAALPERVSLLEERAARRRAGTRVGLARSGAHRYPAFVRAVGCRQLLALTSVPLLVLVALCVVVLRHAAPDDARHRRSARIRFTGHGPEVHAVLVGTVGRALLVTIFLPGVGHAADDVSRWRRRRTRVREAGPGTHVRPVRGGAIGRRGLLALRAIVVRDATLDVALVLHVVGHVALHHVLALVVAHFDEMPLRIDAEELRVTLLRAAEAGGPASRAIGRQGADAPAPAADVEALAGRGVAGGHLDFAMPPAARRPAEGKARLPLRTRHNTRRLERLLHGGR